MSADVCLFWLPWLHSDIVNFAPLIEQLDTMLLGQFAELLDRIGRRLLLAPRDFDHLLWRKQKPDLHFLPAALFCVEVRRFVVGRPKPKLDPCDHERFYKCHLIIPPHRTVVKSYFWNMSGLPPP